MEKSKIECSGEFFKELLKNERIPPPLPKVNFWRQEHQIQGYNARKVISKMYESFVVSLGGNVNTKRMSKPDMGFIFHIKNQ